MKLNRFDALADLDLADGEVSSTRHNPASRRAPSGPLRSTRSDHASPNRHSAMLLVHDSSNQNACSVGVPFCALKSAAALTMFLQKKGFTVPESSLITVHEDRVPCQLQVVKPTCSAPLVSKPTSADVVVHLFNTHSPPSTSKLHEFANVHPDCYATLADCAQQASIPFPDGDVLVDFQSYLEAAFEASIRNNSILYNDCDKFDMKAEWCTWNTGLLWKHSLDETANSYIYLFFKRSLSRVGKLKLAGFSLVSNRQAKPWTMNKPKVISDVQQWLHGAPPPPPPSVELITQILVSKGQAVASIRDHDAAASCSLQSLNLSKTVPSAGGEQDVNSAIAASTWRQQSSSDGCTIKLISNSATSPRQQVNRLSNSSSAARSENTNRVKAARKRRQRCRAAQSISSDTGSGSSVPTTPTKQELEWLGAARFSSLVAILNRACNDVQTRSCGWITSLSNGNGKESALGFGQPSEWWSGHSTWGV